MFLKVLPTVYLLTVIHLSESIVPTPPTPPKDTLFAPDESVMVGIDSVDDSQASKKLIDEIRTFEATYNQVIYVRLKL